MDYKKEYEKMKQELIELKENSLSNKEHILKSIAELFGEDSHKNESYDYQGEKRQYVKLVDFYDAMGRMGKDNLIELRNKIREAQKDRNASEESK